MGVFVGNVLVRTPADGVKIRGKPPQAMQLGGGQATMVRKLPCTHLENKTRTSSDIIELCADQQKFGTRLLRKAGRNPTTQAVQKNDRCGSTSQKKRRNYDRRERGAGHSQRL